MRFQFAANQPHQVRAIESVAALFQGQPRMDVDWTTAQLGDLFGPVANRLTLDEPQLLANLNAVQRRNELPADAALHCIEETIRTASGDHPVRFPNFSVEMETGTGKTYVYLRSAVELHRRYGLRKFIVVVPSVAVREGVLKTLKVTETHLRSLYGNVAYHSAVYDALAIAKVRDFAQSDSVGLLVMTIDSFNKEDNVIRRGRDQMQGAVPLFSIQAVRPVLILNEPQNMESGGRIQALATLDPLFALRYSATHRNPYNRVYQLTPFEAYRGGLVKHIEVASVVREDDYGQVFLRLDEIRSAKKTVEARIALHRRMAKGAIAEKVVTCRPGDRLDEKAGRPEYAPFRVDEIVPAEGLVRFTNNVALRLHETRGGDEQALFREQIRYTVEEHFRKQARLRGQGVKVLSLFFIDRVQNYAPSDGLIRRLFVEAFDDLKTRYPEWSDRKAGEVQAAYFAQKRRKDGSVERLDSKTGDSKEDRAAYGLIMREKERLLSFAEPVAFLFSHSALREGWDNPNVFQICTLNQSRSELKNRQEVGRGMRLAVNQAGDRVDDPRVNVLTVVANEHYEQYVAGLQAEMVEAFGPEGAAPKPTNARQRRAARLRGKADFPPEFAELWERTEFAELWERIKHQTRYRVTIDTPRLIAEVVAALDRLQVNPPRVVVTKAAVQVTSGKDALEALRLSGARTVANLAGRFPLPNLVAVLADLLEHTTPPVRLSRATLLEIVRRMKIRQAALDNPTDFATKAAAVIKEHVARQLVDGIQYEKDGGWYAMERFDPEFEAPPEKLVPVTRSIYDHIAADSGPERAFVAALERRDDVRLFVKLPNWFKVPTPVGTYNPDWAIVMEDRDQYGDAASRPLLYLVRETKSAPDGPALRESERQKVHCGGRHFTGALGVDFKVVANADDLPG